MRARAGWARPSMCSVQASSQRLQPTRRVESVTRIPAAFSRITNGACADLWPQAMAAVTPVTPRADRRNPRRLDSAGKPSRSMMRQKRSLSSAMPHYKPENAWARISHKVCAAVADPGMSAALRSVGLLDVLSSTPVAQVSSLRPRGICEPWQARCLRYQAASPRNLV